MSRTRTRTSPTLDLPFGLIHYERYNSGVKTDDAYFDLSSARYRAFEGYEVITDETGSSRAVKPVDHYKKEVERFPSASSRYYAPDLSYDNRYNGPGATWYNWFGISGSSVAAPDPYSVVRVESTYDRTDEQLVRDAVHDFYSANETDNLLNAIESPQLLSLLKSIKLLLNKKEFTDAFIKSLFTKKEARKRFAGKFLTPKALLKRSGNVSGLYLAYSFGVAPLITDLKKLQKSIETIKSQLASARSSAGKLVSIHRSDTGKLLLRRLSDDSEAGTGVVYDKIYYQLIMNTCRRVVTVRGTRTQKFSSASLANLDYLMTKFVATGPASLAWELIPFSFVLDWFVDIRNITDRLDNLLTGANKQIVDVCISRKTDYNIAGTLHLGYDPAVVVIADENNLLYKDKVTHYTRSPVFDFNQVGYSGRFGKKQASYLAALIHQSVANLVRR